MKFSYSNDRNAYVVTDRGVAIDSDSDPAALRARHGLCEVFDEAQMLVDFGALPDFDEIAHQDQIFDFDTAIEDDDDLAVIREFLED
jgi:hypothetical protein